MSVFIISNCRVVSVKIGHKIDYVGKGIAEKMTFFSLSFTISFLHLILKIKFLKKNSLLRKKFCSKKPIFNFSKFAEDEK